MALSSAVSCATVADPAPRSPPAVSAISAPSSSGSAWLPPPEQTAPEKGELIPLELRAGYRLSAREDGARDLIAQLLPLGIERVVGRVPPGHRCLAGQRNTMAGQPLVAACGSARLSTMVWAGASLRITDTDGKAALIPLPEAASRQFLSGPVEDPDTTRCKGAPPSNKVVLFSLVTRAVEDPSAGPVKMLFLRSSELDFELEIGRVDAAYCHGRWEPSLQQYQATCTRPWVGSTLRAKVTGDAVYFSDEHEGYDARGAGPVGGVRLPCGVSVHFPVLHQITPGFESRDGLCRGRCEQQKDLCDDRCAPLPEENPDASRETCRVRCQQANETCRSRCALRARGIFRRRWRGWRSGGGAAAACMDHHYLINPVEQGDFRSSCGRGR